MRTHNRARLQSALDIARISHGIHYPIPIHLQPACQDLGCGRGSFPVVEGFMDKILSLPMFPEITAVQQGRVTAAIAGAQ